MVGHDEVVAARMRRLPVRLIDLFDGLPFRPGVNEDSGVVRVNEPVEAIERLDLRFCIGMVVTIHLPAGDARAVPLLMRVAEHQPKAAFLFLPDANVCWTPGFKLQEFDHV